MHPTARPCSRPAALSMASVFFCVCVCVCVCVGGCVYFLSGMFELQLALLGLRLAISAPVRPRASPTRPSARPELIPAPSPLSLVCDLSLFSDLSLVEPSRGVPKLCGSSSIDGDAEANAANTGCRAVQPVTYLRGRQHPAEAVTLTARMVLHSRSVAGGCAGRTRLASNLRFIVGVDRATTLRERALMKAGSCVFDFWVGTWE